MSVIIDRSIIKMGNHINSLNNQDTEIDIIQVYDYSRLYVGIGYSLALSTYRFASIGVKNGEESFIYYYDVHQDAFEDLEYNQVKELLIKSVIAPPLPIEADEIDTSDKIEPQHRVWGILNLLICEVIDYYEDNPYLHGHTALIEIDKHNVNRHKDMLRNKIVTLIQDSINSIKNVADDNVLKLNTINERVKYIKEHYEELMNILDGVGGK